MNPAQFIAKWRRVQLTERSASQQHFLDLCALLGHETPAAADPEGSHFTFERGAAKLGGGDGWADVWKKGFFGWEYKGKHKDLDKAYGQLLLYREDLDNPPLLVVCDLDRIVVHTNFTNTPKRVHTVHLEDLGSPRSLEVLRAVFFDPDQLRPGVTSQAVTEGAARHVGEIAQGLRDRGFAADAARDLDELRRRWLDPPEWTREEVLEFPGSAGGPWSRCLHDPDERGIGTVRWPRLVPRDTDCAARLKARTLTNLYNQRPAWLARAHATLDAAVLAAYGWPADLADDALLEHLLALNLKRAAEEQATA